MHDHRSALAAEGIIVNIASKSEFIRSL